MRFDNDYGRRLLDICGKYVHRTCSVDGDLDCKAHRPVAGNLAPSPEQIEAMMAEIRQLRGMEASPLLHKHDRRVGVREYVLTEICVDFIYSERMDLI